MSAVVPHLNIFPLKYFWCQHWIQ